MKLLFDQNLSPRLPRALADVFPEGTHVRDHGLEAATDAEVWAWAQREGFAIVTKDSGFRQRSFVYGHPPKVIWVAIGNCTTEAIERLLRTRAPQVAAFLHDPEKAFLVLL